MIGKEIQIYINSSDNFSLQFDIDISLYNMIKASNCIKTLTSCNWKINVGTKNVIGTFETNIKAIKVRFPKYNSDFFMPSINKKEKVVIKNLKPPDEEEFQVVSKKRSSLFIDSKTKYKVSSMRKMMNSKKLDKLEKSIRKATRNEFLRDHQELYNLFIKVNSLIIYEKTYMEPGETRRLPNYSVLLRILVDLVIFFMHLDVLDFKNAEAVLRKYNKTLLRLRIKI